MPRRYHRRRRRAGIRIAGLRRNSSSAPIGIGGWAILYASSSGTTFGGVANYHVQFPAGATIPASGYYLIQCASGSNTAAQPLPVTPDAIGSIAMSATACKIGLVTSGTTGTCSTSFVDLVATGTSTQCWEGTAPTAATSNTNAAVRNLGGMTDSDNNVADFTITACDASLPIRNSASATNPEYTVVPAMSETWGRVKMLYR